MWIGYGGALRAQPANLHLNDPIDISGNDGENHGSSYVSTAGTFVLDVNGGDWTIRTP
jgi:hypothetical protein